MALWLARDGALVYIYLSIYLSIFIYIYIYMYIYIYLYIYIHIYIYTFIYIYINVGWAGAPMDDAALVNGVEAEPHPLSSHEGIPRRARI